MPLPYFSHRCDNCGTLHLASFWEHFADEWHEANDEDSVTYRDMSHLELTMNHRLCCDNLPANCDCKEPIEWEDSYDVDPDTYWNLYETDEEDNTLCIKCEHYFAVTCIPLRRWLKAFSLENIDSGKITEFCGNFKPDTPVTIKQTPAEVGKIRS